VVCLDTPKSYIWSTLPLLVKVNYVLPFEDTQKTSAWICNLSLALLPAG